MNVEIDMIMMIAYYSRLQVDSEHDVMVLNSNRIWNDRVDSNVLVTVEYCKSLLYKVCGSACI